MDSREPGDAGGCGAIALQRSVHRTEPTPHSADDAGVFPCLVLPAARAGFDPAGVLVCTFVLAVETRAGRRRRIRAGDGFIPAAAGTAFRAGGDPGWKVEIRSRVYSRCCFRFARVYLGGRRTRDGRLRAHPALTGNTGIGERPQSRMAGPSWPDADPARSFVDRAACFGSRRYP